MMKWIILTIISLNLYAGDAYNQLKEMTAMGVELQNEVQLYSHLVNESKSIIEQECSNSGETDCVISKPINIFVTQELYDLGLKNKGVTVGGNLPLPAGFVTFKNLPKDNKFDYSIKLDLTKVGDNGSIVFNWSSNSDMKTMIFKNDDESSKITLFKESDEKILLMNSSFIEMGITFKFNFKMTQYDSLKNGVKIKLEFVDNTGRMEIIAKADNDGGFVHYIMSDNFGNSEIKETFDANGTTIDIASKMPGMDWDKSINVQEYDITQSDMVTNSVNINVSSNTTTNLDNFMFVVVPKNEDVNDNNILAYGNFFDGNSNDTIDKEELIIDYFGDENLLAETNSTSDTDSLDVYIINLSNDGTESFEPINNIWLSK